MSGSPYFPDNRGVRYAPRSDEETEDLNVRVPASVKLIVRREAKAAGVSVAYFVNEALTRFAEETHAERTMGLVRIPIRFDSEQIDNLEAAASRTGLSLTTWANHALLDKAAEPAPAENIKEKAAA